MAHCCPGSVRRHRPQLAKADNASQGASVGQPTEPCLDWSAGRSAQIADAETADPQTQRLGRARGWRSVTFTPMMSRGTFIGFIVCTRRETGVIADHHVQLLRTFADQAVIAIENTRLFNETREALERQTATADMLKVIASSPTDLQLVFDAIAERSNRLIRGHATIVMRFVGDIAELAAFTSVSPEADAALQAAFPVAKPNLAFDGCGGRWGGAMIVMHCNPANTSCARRGDDRIVSLVV
jgi:hypothetical protein